MEDSDLAIEGMRRIIERTPEHDLVFAGSHKENTPDLPDLVKKSGAEVVVADLVLALGLKPEEVSENPECDGFAAIAAIRKRLGREIQILALTAWPDLRAKAGLKL